LLEKETTQELIEKSRLREGEELKRIKLIASLYKCN